MKSSKLVYSNKYTSYSREELLEMVAKRMSEKRFKHVLGVESTALEIAEKYNCDLEMVSIAALTHDYGKERSDSDYLTKISQNPDYRELEIYGNAIWHGAIGADFVEAELGIDNQEILHAIRIHTTGDGKMNLLDKILYVADYIEPGRTFPGVEEARKISAEDLDAGVRYEIKHTLQHLINNNIRIHPKQFLAYNTWVAQ